MALDVVELLDRQHARLQAKEATEFVHELRRFHEFITDGPDAVTEAMADLRRSAEATLEAFNEHDRVLVPELVKLKQELVQRAPAADDSGVPRPRPAGPAPPPFGWMFSFANFDQVAASGPDHMVNRQGYDDSQSGMLVRILEAKLREIQWSVPDGSGRRPSEINQRPDLDDLARRLRNLGERHRHAAQTVSQAIERDGGFQVLRLDMTVAEMNPAATEVHTDDDEHAWMNDVFKRVGGGWHVIEDAASGRPLDSRAIETLEHHIAKLKPAAERVYEDIRLKLATASPPPVAPRRYGQRLREWVLSPGYQLLGGPCLGGVLTALVTGERTGWLVFAALAVALAMLPPFRSRPPVITYTRASIGFVVIATITVVTLLIVIGLGWAFAAFALLAVVFMLGQRAQE